MIKYTILDSISLCGLLLSEGYQIRMWIEDGEFLTPGFLLQRRVGVDAYVFLEIFLI